MKYVFVTGVPGSAWGWPQLYTQNATTIVDSTDRKPWRVNNAKDHPTRHLGSYFGPYQERGEFFDHLSIYNNRQAIFDEIDSAFDPTDQHLVRFALCHHFSYQLDWIAENLPEVDILLSLRNVEISWDMWHAAGGWEIDHPSYRWYGDDHRLWRQMNIEHKLMQKFVQKHNLDVQSGFDADWCDRMWPEMAPFVDKSKYGPLGAAAGQGSNSGLNINTDSLNWALYRGRESTPILPNADK
jgi:hypothetical protein